LIERVYRWLTRPAEAWLDFEKRPLLLSFQGWAHLRSYHLATQRHWALRWELAFHVWRSIRAQIARSTLNRKH